MQENFFWGGGQSLSVNLTKKKRKSSDNILYYKETKMANALTGITDYSNTSGLNAMSGIRSGISSAKAAGNNGIRSFRTLLEEKIYNNGQMNESRLNRQEKKLYSACTEMESLLWKQVLDSMKKTINQYKLFDGGQAEEIFTDFLYDEYASMMSGNAGTGIAAQIYRQLSGN